MGDSGRLSNTGREEGALGLGKGVLCRRDGIHHMPQDIRRRTATVGLAGTQGVAGILRLQGGQGDVCPAHTTILGTVATMALHAQAAAPARRQHIHPGRTRCPPQATDGIVHRYRLRTLGVAPVETHGGSKLQGVGRISAGLGTVGPLADTKASCTVRGTPAVMEDALQGPPTLTSG